MKKSGSITLVFLGMLASLVISGCGGEDENETALTKEERQEQDQQIYGHHSTIIPYYLMRFNSIGSLNENRGSSFIESIKSVPVKSQIARIARGGFGSIGRGFSAGS